MIKLKEVNRRTVKYFTKKYNFCFNWVKDSVAFAIYDNGCIDSILLIQRAHYEYYEWELFDFSHINNKNIDKNFNKLWDIFINNKICHSCVCRNAKLMKNMKLKEFKYLGDNIWSYYPFSIVYRVDDETDGSFYIGMCESKLRWDNGYLGSGTKWASHLKKNKEHKYNRKILKSNFNTPKETREYEQEKINDSFNKLKNSGNERKSMNISLSLQSYYTKGEPCPDCGGLNGQHRKGCAKINTCPECGGVRGNHKEGCPHDIVCPDCGGRHGKHKKTCDKAPEFAVCPECGYKLVSHKHAPTCSHYKKKEPCPECGSVGITHKRSCAKFVPIICEKCGGRSGKHFKTCSEYKVVKCVECGGLNGWHSKDCKFFNKDKDKRRRG